MKAKVSFTFATKQFENIKPEVEFEIPEMDIPETYLYFENMFSTLKQPDDAIPKRKQTFKKFDDMDDDEFIKESGKLLDKKPELKAWIAGMYMARGLDTDKTNGLDDGEGKEKKYEGKGTREHFTVEESEVPF